MPTKRRKMRGGNEYDYNAVPAQSSSWWDSLVKKSEGATSWFSDLLNKDITLSASSAPTSTQPVSNTYYGGKKRKHRNRSNRSKSKTHKRKTK